jgi:hypothetical protein
MIRETITKHSLNSNCCTMLPSHGRCHTHMKGRDQGRTKNRTELNKGERLCEEINGTTDQMTNILMALILKITEPVTASLDEITKRVETRITKLEKRNEALESRTKYFKDSLRRYST